MVIDLDRIKALAQIIDELDEELVICNIGFPSRELYQIQDNVKYFYMLGSMGLASSIGLGLAISILNEAGKSGENPRKVVVFDGDGSILMNLGSLITISAQKPSNLILITLDNKCYGSTGCQSTYSEKVNLSDLARVAGFPTVLVFEEKIEFKKALESKGPVFVQMKVNPGNADVPIIDLEPEEIKYRFMQEIKNSKLALKK